MIRNINLQEIVILVRISKVGMNLEFPIHKQNKQIMKQRFKEVKNKYSKDEFILTLLFPCSFVLTLTKETNEIEFHFAVETPHLDIH